MNSCMSIEGLPTNWCSLVAHYSLLYFCLDGSTLLLLLRCSSYQVAVWVVEELVDEYPHQVIVSSPGKIVCVDRTSMQEAITGLIASILTTCWLCADSWTYTWSISHLVLAWYCSWRRAFWLTPWLRGLLFGNANCVIAVLSACP